MRLVFALLLLLALVPSAPGAPTGPPLTVQGAIKLLSQTQAKNIVRIEARDGAPAPDRWYIQVYDPSAENGLREIVVWERNIVASRTLSQFLDTAKADDVIGSKSLRIDSDELLKITQQYVEANNLESAVATLNYSMYRDEGTSSPVWKLTCFDESGKKLAGIVINARNGSVVSHEGFDLVPGQTSKPAIPVAQPVATPQPGVAVAATPAPVPIPTAVPVASAVPVSTPLPALASPSPAAIPVATPKTPSPSPGPSASPTPKRGLFQKIFGGGAKPTPTPTPTPRIH